MDDPSACARTALRRQRVETPSWGYGNSGTRFKVFTQPGVPRDPWGKIKDIPDSTHLGAGQESCG